MAEEKRDPGGNEFSNHAAQSGPVQGVRYQTVCSVVQDSAQGYCTYGLECLADCRGTWVQMDVIEDVSPSRDNVLFLADRFNSLGLSPLHFRDAVLDSIDG